MARLEGPEPPTNPLERDGSIQLNYRRMEHPERIELSSVVWSTTSCPADGCIVYGERNRIRTCVSFEADLQSAAFDLSAMRPYEMVSRAGVEPARYLIRGRF